MIVITGREVGPGAACPRPSRTSSRTRPKLADSGNDRASRARSAQTTAPAKGASARHDAIKHVPARCTRSTNYFEPISAQFSAHRSHASPECQVIPGSCWGRPQRDSKPFSRAKTSKNRGKRDADARGCTPMHGFGPSSDQNGPGIDADDRRVPGDADTLAEAIAYAVRTGDIALARKLLNQAARLAGRGRRK